MSAILPSLKSNMRWQSSRTSTICRRSTEVHPGSPGYMPLRSVTMIYADFPAIKHTFQQYPYQRRKPSLPVHAPQQDGEALLVEACLQDSHICISRG